jgi:hypothetical protein
MTVTPNNQSADQYKGSNLLKKSGTPIEWTPELMQEWFRCSQDPLYFARNYIKIINVDKGSQPFDMYPYQEEMIRSMAENRYTIVATARQAGKTTSICAFILWYVLFNKDKTVALLAQKGETAREILTRVRYSYTHLPGWLQHGQNAWNKGSLELENGSRVIAAATSSDNIRGYAINLLFIDEAAHIENWDEFFTSVFPTISSGKQTKICLVSTPLGLNHFYKIWTETGIQPDGSIEIKDRRNEYNPIKVTWNQVPGRDAEWLKTTIENMGNDQEKFDQEFNVEFMGSSGTLISGRVLKTLVHRTPITSYDGLSVYHPATPGRNYVLVADSSQGKGLDYSAFHIIDVTEMPYQQVVTFRNNLVPPVEYAEIVGRMARMYNHATVLGETNEAGLGNQMLDCLFETEYDNFLYTENAGRAGKRVSLNGKAERGCRMTQPVKQQGCSLLKLLVEQYQLIINDFHTIEEAARFSKKNNSYQAESGCHDDLMMGLVLFAWLTDQPFFHSLTDHNVIEMLRDRSKDELEQHLSIFGDVVEIDTIGTNGISELPEGVSFEQWFLE